MPPNFTSLTVSENLLRESTQTICSLEPVLFFYLAAFALAAALWTIGVLVFGRRRTRSHKPAPAAERTEQRITPAAF